MPIRLPYKLPRISDDAMRLIDYEVMKHAFACHSARGRLCDEAVYQTDLSLRLRSAGFEAETEVPIKLSLGNFESVAKIDLLVDRKVIYELKTVERFTPKHEAQCLGYLFMAESTHGKLINFRRQSVESRFVNTSRTLDERRKVDWQTNWFSGEPLLLQVIRELIEDWGVGLDASLYRKAILKCAGEETAGDYLLPISDSGRSLGNQQFHLLNSDTGLAVTTYSKDAPNNRNELAKIVSISPLKHLHWVNITHGHVCLETIPSG
jgi:GxxExxY protein